ncbi:MAG: hypothetical protein K0S47_3588 [Herbinix sp.]|jgi:hypothetical protein|nr:hypothetical protein [Herbinix sp.]
MDKQTLLHYVAPCSLFCYTCPALKDGAIAETASKLCTYFEGYYDFNDENIPEQYRSWLNEFEVFYKILNGYTKSKCPGCRNNPSSSNGCIEGCVVPSCVKEHGIDFCAECSDFPCQKGKDFFITINNTIRRDWELGSNRIKEIGIERYFNEKKDVSHYISYKK